MREGIHIRIQLVILPLDAFTGKAILQEDFSVLVEGAAKPFVKPEGYRVFSQINGRFAVVRLWGRFYQRTKIKIDLLSLKPNNPVQKCYVLPERAYPFPPGTAYMEGRLGSHSVLLAAALSGIGSFRLRADCGEGDTGLTVYQDEPEDLAGRTFFLTDKNRSRFDWVELVSYAHGSYYLKKPLAHAYRTIEAKLYPAVRYAAEESGEACFIPLRAREDTLAVRCRFRDEQGERDFEVSLRAGETLYHDF